MACGGSRHCLYSVSTFQPKLGSVEEITGCEAMGKKFPSPYEIFLNLGGAEIDTEA